MLKKIGGGCLSLIGLFVVVAIVVAVFAAMSGPDTSSSTGGSTYADRTTNDSDTTTKAKPKPNQPHFTPAQANAIGAVHDYLNTSSFSHDGMVNQLVQGDGYSKKNAVFAVNHVHIDYNKQAVASAKDYLDIDHFSHDGLVNQLVQGDQYTHAQAEFAAKKVGL